MSAPNSPRKRARSIMARRWTATSMARPPSEEAQELVEEGVDVAPLPPDDCDRRELTAARVS